MQIKMIKNNILLATLIVSGNAFAQSCGDIADGTVVRLDSPGKSLQNFRTQDQDGLGICYANTGSVLLQSKLPGNPEISYLNIASVHAEKANAPMVRKNNTDRATKEGDIPLMDAGNPCRAINALVEKGSVCKRSDVALEQFFHSANSPIAADKTHIQKDIVDKLSKYYDDVFKSFGRNTADKAPKGQDELMALIAPKQATPKFEEYKNALKHVLSKKKEKFTQDFCLKPDTKQAEAVVSNLMGRIYEFVNNPKNAKNPHLKTIRETGKKLGETVRGRNSKGAYFFIITVGQDTKKSLENNYVKAITNTNIPQEKAMLNAIKALSPAFNDAALAALGGFGGEAKFNFIVDEDRYIKKNIEECTKKAQFEYFTNENGLKRDFQNDTCLSKYVNHADNIKQLVTTLDRSNLKNLDSLYSFLMDLPEMNYEQAMMKMLGPDCPDQKKLKLPPGLKCETTSLYYQSGDTDESFLRESKNKIRSLAKEEIGRGGAVGMSMCTQFYDKETPNAFYNKTKQCSNTLHGFHAVSMVGYKCEAGKMKYLIQNSWGEWDDAKLRFLETEPGKAWMTEDDLARNTNEMYQIKN